MLKRYHECIVLPAEFPFTTYAQILDTRYDRMHKHEYLEMTYILEGEGIYYESDQCFDVRAGDLVLSNNATFHFAFAKSRTERCVEQVYEFLPVVLAEDLSSCMGSKCLDVFFGKQRILHVGTNPESSPIVRLLLSIIKEFEYRAPGYEMVISGKLRTIVGLVYRELAQGSLSMPKIGNNMYRLLPEIAFINTYLHENITLSEVAATVHLHPSYFSRVFSSTMGCMFQQYVQRMRLSKALILLRHSDQNILDIALNCGFANESVFYRSFKNMYGMTPAQYRNSMKEA